MIHDFALTVEHADDGLYTVTVSDGAGSLGTVSGHTLSGVLFRAHGLLLKALTPERGGRP